VNLGMIAVITMQLQEDIRDYYGKPWWCHTCQWQFSEEELKEE
jgi:hypothetical protein